MIKRRLCIIFSVSFFIISFPIMIFSSFEFSGYIINFPSLQKVPDSIEEFGVEFENDYIFIDLTRCRLKPVYYFSDNTRIELNYELDVLIARSQIPLISTGGRSNRQAVNLYRQIFDEEYLKVNHFIDIFYFKHLFDFGEITVGRQALSWGVGRVWQPTDLFNPINPAIFNKIEKDGVDAVSAKVYLGQFSDIDFVYNFKPHLSQSNTALRLRTNIEEYDLSGIIGYFDDKYILGASFVGNMFDAGFRGEAALTLNPSNNHKEIRAVVGFDNQFTDKLYCFAEYQYNGPGTSNQNEYSEYFSRLFKGEIQNIGENYLAFAAVYQLSPLVLANIMSIVNLNDKSGLTSLSCKYEWTQNFNLSAGLMLFWGSEKSEYWHYMNALYLNFEFYF